MHTVEELERGGRAVLVTAMTGAASEVIGGVTLHSAVGYKIIQVRYGGGKGQIGGLKRCFLGPWAVQSPARAAISNKQGSQPALC